MTPRRSPISNTNAQADDDPLRTMTVERVTRPDGRYLLYFGWPAPDDGPSGPQPTEGESDDV